ncbi:MAG: hypothetical protein O3C57_01875, partial [Verrucomicrobia bacterium]|nr:hypothetical protein [Verrucomicrobiota bacterium]
MPDRRIHNLWLLLFFADFCAIVSSYLLTLWLRFDSAIGGRLFDRLNSFLDVRETGALGPHYELFYQAAGFRITCFLAIIICTIYALRDLYTERRFIIRQSVAADILVSNVIALFLIYAYFYLDRNVFHPRSIFALMIVINVFLSVWYRGLIEVLLRHLRRRYGWDRWPVLLIGKGKSADLIEAHVRGHEPHGLYMAERLNIAPHHDIDKAISRAREAAEKHHIGMFIVVDNDMSVSQIMSFLEMSDKLDLPVKVLSDKLDVLINRARIRFDIAFGGALYHFASVSNAERFQW